MKRYFLAKFGNVSKRMLSFLLALVMVLGMCPVIQAAGGTTLYVKPNANWLNDGARFAVYCFEGSNNTWVDREYEI